MDKERLTQQMPKKVKNAKIALIDQDIEKTLKRLSEEITWKEKGRFVGEVIVSLFKRKKQVQFDLRKVPSRKIIKELTGQLKKKYPSFRRANERHLKIRRKNS